MPYSKERNHRKINKERTKKFVKIIHIRNHIILYLGQVFWDVGLAKNAGSLHLNKMRYGEKENSIISFKGKPHMSSCVPTCISYGLWTFGFGLRMSFVGWVRITSTACLKLSRISLVPDLSEHVSWLELG